MTWQFPHRRQLDRIEARQLIILRRLYAILNLEGKQMALIDDVLAEAEHNSSVGDSVLALVQKLVDSAGGDPAKLQQILTTLKGDSSKLEAAVLANTPQEAPTE